MNQPTHPTQPVEKPFWPTKWLRVEDRPAWEKALTLTRGSYQEDFLRGHQNLSTSTLRGKARKYAMRYKESQRSLLIRLYENEIPFYEETGKNNRRILVIGIGPSLQEGENTE